MSEADAAAGGNKTLKNSRNTDTTTNNSTVSTMEKGATKTTKTTDATLTTRQRRIQQQYHSTNGLWEQPQPRIKQASQREKAYIRSSGLVVTSSKSNHIANNNNSNGTTNTTNDVNTTKNNNDVTSHFAKHLGSTDARIRHQTIRQLKTYLKLRSDLDHDGISEMDLIKLWKCLWYTLYLADRVPVQEELSQQLCSLIWSLAGTIEQDEYIAQSYLDACDGSGFIDEEDDDDDDEEEDNDVDNSEENDDDGDVTMEEIGNTLDDVDEEDDEDSSDSEELDFEAKQLALLQDDIDDDENEDDDEEEDEDEEDDDIDEVGDDVDDENESDDDDDDDDDDETDPMSIQHCQGAHLAALFVRTFWRTCVREWGRMDKYRIDKFYTCLRYMLATMYDYMASRHWSLGIIRLFNDALYEEVLSQVPNGIRYHIIDCCLEELCKSMDRSGVALTEATIIDVLEPYFAISQTGEGDDTLQSRVVEQVFMKFLNQYSVYSEEYIIFRIPQNGKGKVISKDMLVFDQVHVGTLSQFIFQVAADDAVTKDEYRKSLYGVHKEYERRIREVGPEHDVDLGDEKQNDDDSGDDDVDIDDEHDHNNEIENIDNTDDYNRENKAISDLSGFDEDVEDQSSGSANSEKEESGEKIENSIESSATFSKRKKRKKKKSKSTDTISTTNTNIEEIEEVITITKADQKAAQDAMNQKQIDTKNSTNNYNGHTKRQSDNNKDQRDSKRVKFGDNNRARSYKASMNGLNTIEIQPILQKSPDKSILLKMDQSKIVINKQRLLQQQKQLERKP
jgi:hypothetical protein